MYRLFIFSTALLRNNVNRGSLLFNGGKVYSSCVTRFSTDSTDTSGDAFSRRWTEDAPNEDHVKEVILNAALKFVPQHGWTDKAIAEGAVAEGLSGAASGLFSDGAVDLVNHFITKSNKQLVAKLVSDLDTAKEQNTKLDTPVILKNALESRLRMLGLYINTWPQAMSLLVSPRHSLTALNNLHTLVDDIWYIAGDRSLNLSWYGRRGGLAAVYYAAELYMTRDLSADWTDTWRFVDRRLDTLLFVDDCASQVPGAVNRVGDVLYGFPFIVKNIFAFGAR